MVWRDEREKKREWKEKKERKGEKKEEQNHLVEVLFFKKEKKRND